jgi:8-oxo-dGTP pyrophosphatase MutT (NUDIX family)
MKISPERKEILWSNDWMKVVQVDGWFTCYEKLDGISVLILDPLHNKILMRREYCPPYVEEKGQLALTSLTGGIEKKEYNLIDAYETAVKEVEEESGIKISKEDLSYHGSIYSTKASEHQTHLFSLEYDSNIPLPSDIKGDGTLGEEGAFVEWHDFEEVLLNTKSPCILSTIVRKLI